MIAQVTSGGGKGRKIRIDYYISLISAYVSEKQWNVTLLIEEQIDPQLCRLFYHRNSHHFTTH